LKPGGDVYAVAKDVVAIDDDIAEVDANAEGNTPILAHLGRSVGYRRLHFDGAAHSIDHAGELQNPSPVVFTMRPPWRAIAASITSCLRVFIAANVPVSSRPISRE
jgi:hypothetical protein